MCHFCTLWYMVLYYQSDRVREICLTGTTLARCLVPASTPTIVVNLKVDLITMATHALPSHKAGSNLGSAPHSPSPTSPLARIGRSNDPARASNSALGSSGSRFAIPDLNALFLASSSGPGPATTAAAAASSTGTAAPSPPPAQDPIDFLNANYTSEQHLSEQLPLLQDAVTDRLNALDDSISQALSRQSETSDQTRQILPQAVANVQALQHRILLVKSKAIESEKAVFSITSDMKRLDCAKRHLQRTITTLKRLHMLVHAVEQLRLTTTTTTTTTAVAASASTGRPPKFVVMEYRGAAQLVDATRLLLEFFDAYTAKVEPMRLLAHKVTESQYALQQNVQRAFRIVAFGYSKALKLEEQQHDPHKRSHATEHSNEEEDNDDSDNDHDDAYAEDRSFVLPSASDLEGGVLLMDALGESARVQFVHELCEDHLRHYVKEFEPPSRTATDSATKQKRVSSFKVAPPPAEPAKTLSSLAEMEQRFTWFQKVLQGVVAKFPMFPPHWNVQTTMARHFLQLVRWATLQTGAYQNASPCPLPCF